MLRGQLCPYFGGGSFRRFYAAFRFDHKPAPRAWERWARAGANHHSSATPGAYGEAIEQVAAFLGVESVRV